MGAWIETQLAGAKYVCKYSRTLYGCVDWNIIAIAITSLNQVAPYMGAWIETEPPRCALRLCKSHPIWVRGLKLNQGRYKVCTILSHPIWVRGLKLETHNNKIYSLGRTLYGCVDWNVLNWLVLSTYAVAPYMGAWIETIVRRAPWSACGVAPYMGAWIETKIKDCKRLKGYVAPYMGAWIET